MSHAVMRRAVAAVGAVSITALGLGVGGGVASAAPVTVSWNDGNSNFTRTISEANPGEGDVITTSTKFERKAWTTLEVVNQVKDVHPPCLTYVEGSAKVDGSPRALDSQGPDFAKVAGSWTVYPNIDPKSHTFEFSYKVGPDCDRNVPLATRLDYAGGLGSGSYPDKGPSITVRKNASTTTLAAVTNAQVGQAVSLSASVTGGANGDNVEFYDGTAKLGTGPLNNGVATYSWTPAAGGAHPLTAKFLATARADGSQSAAQNVTVSVPDAATTTTLVVPATANVGAAVELKASVSPAAAGGTVQFKDGGTSIGGPVAVNGGAATLSHTFDGAGAKSISAVYSGGAGFTGSTSAPATVTVSVPDAATTTTLVVPATANVGAAVELKATVSPAAAGGTVQFKDGGTNLGGPVAVNGGSATLSHAFDGAGAKSITAVYSGGAGFTGSTSAPATVTVAAVVSDVATTTVLSVPATAILGAPVELKATVSPAPTGGTVQFKNGDANIGGPVNVVDGKATLSHAFAAAGSHAISAVFSGAPGFGGSASAVQSVSVPVPDVVTSIVLTAPATADRGVVVEFSATVSPTPNGGTVQFKDGSTPIGGPVNVVDGKAKLSHTFDKAGAHSISVTYSGFEGFSGAGSQASTVTVAGAGAAGSIPFGS